jgi:ketosteroid isomerase-like protein
MDTKLNDTAAVAHRLVELCRAGKYEQAQHELYAADAVSIEGDGQKADGITRGMAAIGEKSRQWEANIVEVHGGSVGEPIVAGSWFSIVMGIDATYKDMGRVAMNEICVYGVRDGKIVHEQFFYDMDKS